MDITEGDLELYLIGRPWLDYDEFDPKDYFDGVKCANALNILLENKIKDKINLEVEEIKTEKYKLELKSMHAQELKKFKKAYGGGYLGYTKIHNLGNVSQFVDKIDTSNVQLDVDPMEAFKQVNLMSKNKNLENLENLKCKLTEYVLEIPENVTYSILPVLRWESSKGFLNSRSISDSIKIIRNININLIAEKIISDILDNILEYNLRGYYTHFIKL